jgi:hypothetical protein
MLPNFLYETINDLFLSVIFHILNIFYNINCHLSPFISIILNFSNIMTISFRQVYIQGNTQDNNTRKQQSRPSKPHYQYYGRSYPLYWDNA